MKRKLILILTTTIIFSVIGYYTFPAIRDARASWVYTDYLYRSPLTFTHNADISAARRVSITINTSTLISAGKMQSDCDDTRFTNEAQKKLRYQLISGCNTTTTSYDVEVLSAVNGTNTLYLYYGNNSATSESTDISGITSLSPSGGAPSTGSEETAVTPSLMYSLDEGYGTTAQDTTQQNRDGTISGALWRTEDLCVSGKCLYFDGSNDVVTTSGTTSNVRTVAFWVRPMTTTEQLVDLNGSAYIQTSSGTISATGFTSPTIYVNGKVSSALVANRWQHVVVTTGTGLSASALKLGQISTNYGQMFMDEFQLYSTALSESQVKSLYNARGGNLTSTQQGAYDQKMLSDGLVGYWKMDEASWTNNCSTDTVLDSSGNGNNGDSCPNSTGPTGGASGKFGNAGNFDGTNDYINAGSATTLDNLPELTVSVWIYPQSVNTGRIIINKAASSTPTAGWHIRQNVDGGITFEVNYASINLSSEVGTAILQLNTWQNVTVTWDGSPNASGVKIYLNGIQQNANNNTNSSGTRQDDASHSLYLGSSDILSSWSRFTGSLDEVRIYAKQLSAQEIQQLYNWAPGPVGYWKMDEGSGTTTYDSSAQSNHGTLYNTASFQTGKFGQAIFFDGVHSTVDTHVGLPDNIFNSNSQGTISLWFRLSTEFTDGDYPILFGAVETDAGGSFTEQLDINFDDINNTLEIFGKDNNVVVLEADTPALTSPLEWHHVALTMSPTGHVLYLNGIAQSLTYSTGSSSTSIWFSQLADKTPISYTIGCLKRSDGNSTQCANSAGVTNTSFEGRLDDIRIYNYPRTPSQIIQDMNAGHPLIGTPIAGPVAHYKFDEGYGTTAQDTTTNNNDLTHSATSYTNDGRIGKAWNGQGSRWLTRADDADLDFTANQDFSLALWVKSDNTSNPATSEFIIDKQIATNNPGYRLYFNTSGQIVCDIDDDTTSYPEDSVTTSADYYDAAWHHIICVRDITSDKLNLYIDGKLNTQDTDLSATGDLSNTDSLTIGDSDAIDNGSEFNGDIDELKIYRASLTASEVQVEFNQGKTLVLGSLSTESNGTTLSNADAREYCVPGDTSTCNPPIGHWKLDENSGNTTYDSSTNNNTGTIVDGSFWTPGKKGSALMFDTLINNYINAGSATALDNLSAMSVSFWTRKKNGNDIRVIMKDDGFGSTGWQVISQKDEDIEFLVGYTTTNLTGHSTDNDGTHTTNSYDPSKWYHVAVSWDGTPNTSGIKIYHEGRSVSVSGTNAGGTRENDQTNDLRFDSRPGFSGDLDDIRLYNYVRTPAQIAWEFNRGAPLAWWKFDETSGTTTFDSSQNGNGKSNGSTGTLTNTPTRITSGRVNSAIDFDGTDDVVSVTNNTRIDHNDALSQGFTYSAWVYPQTDGESDVGRIFEKTTATYCRTTNDDGTNLDLECSLDLATDATVTVTDALPKNQWSHILMTWSDDADDEITLYINGKSRGSSTNGVGSPSTDSANLLIGGPTTANFDGYIDEFKIYNYEVTKKQAEIIMNEGNAIRM